MLTKTHSHTRQSACCGRVRYPERHPLEAKNNLPHPTRERLRHTCGKAIHFSRSFTSMETVLSWSLLMAFSAAVTVFTVSVCFSLSSFCERKNMKNVRTSTRQIRPAGRCERSGCFMKTQRLLPVLQVVSGIPRAGPGDSEQQLLQVQTPVGRFSCPRRSAAESNMLAFLYCPKIALGPRRALRNFINKKRSWESHTSHRCLGPASGGRLAEGTG